MAEEENDAELLAAFRARYEGRVRCLACANPYLRAMPTLYRLAAIDGEPLIVAAMRCERCGRVQLFAVDTVVKER